MSVAQHVHPAGPVLDSPQQELLRTMEVFTRSLRETSYQLARELPCSRGAAPVVRLLERHGTLQVGDLAEILHVDISVASRLVSQLVSDGHVERTVAGTDRRGRTLRLTPSGLDLGRAMRATVDTRFGQLFAEWTDQDLADAARTLERLAATVEVGSRTTHRHDPAP